MGKFNAKRVFGAGEHEDVEIVLSGEKPCGNGKFSNVYVANLDQPAKQVVAIKNAWVAKEDMNMDPYPEIKILSQLRHPHIAGLLYHFRKAAAKEEKEICYSLVLEYLPEDMGRMFKNGHKFDVLDVKLYGWQLFCALDYLSSYDIAHLDIKPANIVMDHKEGLLKLTDFGNAKVLRSDETYLPYQVTRYYRAPELLFNATCYSPSVDVWAGACVIGEMYTGRPLFKASSAREQMRLIVDIFNYPTDEETKAMKVGRPKVRRGRSIGLAKHCTDLPKDLLALLEKVFIYNVKNRATPSIVLAEPFFAELKKMPKRSNGNKVPNYGYGIEDDVTPKSSNSFFTNCSEASEENCGPTQSSPNQVSQMAPSSKVSEFFIPKFGNFP